MTPAEILIAARERIAIPERWTQGGFAKDVDGGVVLPNSPGATCWCASGALRVITKNDGNPNWVAWRLLDRAVGGQIVSCWNDAADRTHPEVLAAFDRAIELARAEADA